MSWYHYLFGILGLALLMVVHETGHLLVARTFNLRVVRFSIGFGPTLWRYQARGSETIYQIALIPFLAYVQIAGMNPFEEVDPNDRQSYANAPLFARTATIFAGPLGNYLCASVLFFIAFAVGGVPTGTPTTTIRVADDTPAAAAKLQDGDRVVRIGKTPIKTWDQLREIVLANPGKRLEVEVQRRQQSVVLEVTPRKRKDGEGGEIGIQAVSEFAPITLPDAALRSVVAPTRVVRDLVVGLARIITGKEKPQLTGPVGIVKVTGQAAADSWTTYVAFLAMLSAYLGGFNLVPFPALDGGRMMFLGYEAVTRRRPNARIEAHIHAVGLLMLLALIAVVSVFDIRGN
jgi:regulator of sigma E protease